MFEGDFLEFFGQLPPAVPLAFCGFMLLLVVSLVLLVTSGTRKRQNRVKRTPADRAVSLPTAPASTLDLPDLDLLLGAEPVTSAAVSPNGPTRSSGTYWLQLSDGRRVEAADVLTVSRDLADGSLIVQIGNRAYSHATEITDDESRRRLKGALRELAQQVTVAPREPEAEPEAALGPTQTPQPVATNRVPSVAADTASPNQASVPPADGSWKLPNFTEMANEPLKLRGGKPKQAVPEINIAGAIEAYLQHKVQQTPAFAHRRLHIHGASGGGVRIEVDGRFYEAVSDIEDAPTREFIAGAIQEWQATQ